MFRIDQMAYGRFGNKLLYYNNLRQLAILYGTDYSCIPWEGQKIFNNLLFEEEYKNQKKNIVQLSSKELLTADKNDISKVLEKYDISLLAPCLGELFFSVTKTDPKKILHLPLEENKELTIGLHFRGSDFFAWNPDACMPTSYYINAIDLCEKEHNEQKKYILYTEDVTYKPFNEIKEFLEKEKIPYELGPATKEYKHFSHDFVKLANSDIIVSSPSTFAICAGFLGKEKKIIYSEDWINNRVNVNDRLWTELNSGGNKWYNIWRVC
jgi:hypothetical protein